VFGVGPQELIVIVLLMLLVFGPVKAAGVARDLGRFAGEARGQVEELKSELVTSSGEDQEEDRRSREPRTRGRVGAAPAAGGDRLEGEAGPPKERGRGGRVQALRPSTKRSGTRSG
jgi:Sec-independent protein translocase protein TatA